MLSRAIAHSGQVPGPRANPASLRIATASLSQVWTRSMARHNKPVQGQNKPLGSQKLAGNNSQPSKPAERGAAAAAGGAFTHQGSQTSSKLGKQDFSKKQEEVSKDASPKRNTTPQSEGRGSGTINEAPRKGEDPAISSKQNEFDTSASPSQNTAPHSTSPSAVDPAEAEAQAKAQANLPDLRDGLPSTWAYENAAKAKSSGLNLTEAEGGDESKGELPASAYISSTERNRNKRFTYMYALFGVGLVAGTTYLGRNWETAELEQEHPDIPQGMTPGLMWARARARYNDMFSYYQKPAFEKLLPNPDPMFGERPYTLVLSLEDLLIKAEWSREHGWRVAKRPGVDYFLRYLQQYYELVIFTSQPMALAEPVIRKLDPFHIVSWPLFREATLYKVEDNTYVKDLAYLNRDLSKVIIMDTKASHVQNQPENAIVLKPWSGNPNDTDLISHIPFLEYIHTMAFEDVRKAIKSFEGKHIPTEFAQREAVARKKFESEYAQSSKKRPRHSGAGFLANALGIKHQSMTDPSEQTASEAFAQGKMLQDVARERGQKQYEFLEKEIRENGEKWLKEEAALEEKAKEEGMKAMKSGFAGFFGGGQK